MEIGKYKKFLKDDNYVHCSICANFRNSNSFAHRKSENHQKRLTIKLRKIKIHLLQKMKSITIHDEQWEKKDADRFCHFCGSTYAEHKKEDEFLIENLGCILHYANSKHFESVKLFLKTNFRTEDPQAYCVQKKQLDSVLTKLPFLKERYLKKMEILNDMMLKEMKVAEESRKKLVSDELQTQASCSYELPNPHPSSIVKKDETKATRLSNPSLNKDFKIPPWLEDIADSNISENKSSTPVIGPTMDNLVKHVADQKKKGLSKNRVGANFKHQIQGSSKWLPSFQGVWNQGRRKQLQISFNRKNKISKS